MTRKPRTRVDYAAATAVCAGGFLLVAWIVVRVLPNWLADTKDLDAAQAAADRGRVRTALLAMLAGAIAVLSAVFTGLTWQLNRRGQHTERYTRAIEQIGRTAPAEVAVRLGGIYALEQIARDSPDLRMPVIEVLTAYVREHARRAHPDDDESPFDVPGATPETTAIMSVLARLPAVGLAFAPTIDLSGTNLARVQAAHIDLRFARLTGTTLTRAFLLEANLEHASLSNSHLQYAELGMANLRQANLFSARLNGADLMFAELVGASLWLATLREAKLMGANLAEADLNDADLERARYDGETVWPQGFDPDAAGAVLNSELQPKNDAPSE